MQTATALLRGVARQRRRRSLATTQQAGKAASSFTRAGMRSVLSGMTRGTEEICSSQEENILLGKQIVASIPINGFTGTINMLSQGFFIFRYSSCIYHELAVLTVCKLLFVRLCTLWYVVFNPFLYKNVLLTDKFHFTK